MRQALAEQAASAWGFENASIILAAARENEVYRVDTGGKTYALRLHRDGYRSQAELQSELAWLRRLADGGVRVPHPVESAQGQLLAQINGVSVSVLSWLEGATLGAPGEMQGVDDRIDFCRKLGVEMAKMHAVSDGWALPSGFSRPSWDREGLLGEDPLWGRFWEHPHLTAAQRSALEAARIKAGKALAQVEASLDFGLIHADAVGQNLMWDSETVAFIDFDDACFGFRSFELATFLLRFMQDDDYPQLREALLEGYSIRRRIETSELDLMLLLRALTYPGWIATRLGEEGSAERSVRAIDTALRVFANWAPAQS